MRCENADLDSWGDASLDIETRRGRKAACNGESMGGEMGGKLWRAMSSGWGWESRAVDGEREDSAGRKDLPRPSLPAGRRLVLRLVVGLVLHRGSGIGSRGRRGRESLEVSTRTRLRGKSKRGGNLESSPPPLSSSTCLRTSRQG